MAKTSGPYAVPDEHVALIGRVAESWAQLEFQIDRGIWHLAATHQQLAACITAQMISVHPRLKAFTALVEVRNGSEKSIKALKSFAGSISPLSDKRNRTVHDPRYKDKATGVIHRLENTAKPTVQFGFFPEPASELQDTIDKIHDRVREFIALRDKAIAEIDALPQESQPSLLQIIDLPKSTQDRSTERAEPPPLPQSRPTLWQRIRAFLSGLSRN